MIEPKKYTELDALVAYIDEQLDGIRCAAYGLSTEQAHERPTRSAFSIGALLTHATFVMDGFLSRRQPGALDPSADDFAENFANDFADDFAQKAKAFEASFVFDEDDTIEDVTARFDASRAAYLAALRVLEPAGETLEPAAPWDNRDEPTPVTWRYALLHHVEELARHAGHADIIREQLDGAQAGSLQFAARGLPGNGFIEPWQPV